MTHASRFPYLTATARLQRELGEMPRDGRGPACLTCREKCRKCDRGRPKCNRCITKGLECGGYPEQFRFCGIASRGKWKGARAPIRGRAFAAGSGPSHAKSQGTTELLTPETDKDDAKYQTGNAQEPIETPPISGNSVECAGETSDEIARLLSLTETQSLLSHYDTFVCPHQISEIGDGPQNPYRSYIIPLAKKQIGLLYAVLGLSASHLGQLAGNKVLHEETAVEYRMKAIRALSEEIRKSQNMTLPEDEQDAILAIIQILLLHDIFETGVSTHGIHITGAMSVCKRLLITEGLSGHRRRAVFFLGNLAWLDIIRAFAGSERLCFSQDIREMVACVSDQSFEMVNGCPREVFLIIGNVLEKSKEHSLGWLSWDEYQISLILAKHKLYSWNRQERTYPSSDPRWESVAEAFQYACILHILRLLDPLRPAKATEVQDCVAKILDTTAGIDKECPLLELLIFPLFMAGADALAAHSQYYVLTRIYEIMRRSEVRNPVPGDLLQKTHSPELARQHDYLII
ncbi:conserved hypothetical protein [Aspergillus terreus NIH2624]|uniref:Zn(2)-C6 fungal-type domain-containing protein n=1 Tax=Aspergillus terreus (strain NIH 2624 / FGSC A1156) TaxID=341663 RepID=Q0C7K2_ASPTN|nr:uncharacterized protein ATEG_10332 [Aspergillus terreus NIH2624]EAU29329.1 conserved hypothetical protein [Aspergillus terreus NIH2624]